MKNIIDINNYNQYDIGTKAKRLFELKEQGLNIPDFFCVEEYDEKSVDEYLSKHMNKVKKFAVRSSCNLEDSESASFAGQFDTFLNISKNEVKNKIIDCIKSMNSLNVEKYCIEKNINKNNIKMNVIVQELINPDYSGVIFTANPKGILNEIVIVIGKGIGSKVVEDKADVTMYCYNKSDEEFYFNNVQNGIVLKKEILEKLTNIAKLIEEKYRNYQDIEFCIKDNEVYILQARNITTLNLSKKRIILDNSNIVESYPGVSLPLTQSFVKEVYYKIFKKCLIRLTSNSKEVKKYDEMLKNMVAVVNGRIYYQISNWYYFIKFLPFDKKIIPLWQEMLGVKTKDVTIDDIKIKLNVRIKVLINFFKLLITNKSQMRKLGIFFESVITNFREKIEYTYTTKELIELYNQLLNAIVKKWDITLVNDMYTFIYTGLLKRKLAKKKTKDEVSRYISSIANLESMKPIMKMKELANVENVEEYKNKKEQYIQRYGDRVLEELKLETKTYRTNPELLDNEIKKYKNVILKNKEYQIKNRGIILKNTIVGIKNREKSRLNRAVLFGIAREIMLKISDNFVNEEKITKNEDIFYLTLEEIEEERISYIDIIKTRKREYEMYKKMPDYSRLEFLDKIVSEDFCESIDSDEKSKYLYGLSTSQGKIRGKVVIVDDINKNYDVEGKILVTKTTDPGWIFLISRCSGIIAEKGSLLSHTAIISRELNKPAIVGIKNATKNLKNGEYIELDANRGVVIKLYENNK